MHFCAFDHKEYPDEQFELLRGKLFIHRGGGEPLHLDDGQLWPTGQVEAPLPDILSPSPAPPPERLD